MSSKRKKNSQSGLNTNTHSGRVSGLTFKEKMKLLKDLREKKIIEIPDFPEKYYTWSKDQEPQDFNRKLQIKLFKKSLITKEEFDKEIMIEYEKQNPQVIRMQQKR